MLKIRMKRAGGKNHPFFRVVVIDSRRARDSRAVEEVGYYNPLEEPLVVNVNRERVEYWVTKGAQLSDSVRTLLRRENTLHPTRRAPEAFEAAAPEEKPARPRKGKAAKAESAVAVADEPKAAEDASPSGGASPATEAPPAAEAPPADVTPASEEKAPAEALPEGAPESGEKPE